jgi:beta-phosphoglucomutase-like phosphatase (HAD superfamily)
MLVDAGRGPTDREIEELARAKRPFYMRRAEAGLVIFEGAERVVRECAVCGPVAVVSGALRDEIEFALGRMGLAGVFDPIVSAEDTTRCKPDPMGYEICVAALAARLGEKQARGALVIEDSLAGIEAAKQAGLACLAVAHSYPEKELVAAGADAVVPRIGAVDAELIRALYARLVRREHA